MAYFGQNNRDPKFPRKNGKNFLNLGKNPKSEISLKKEKIFEEIFL